MNGEVNRLRTLYFNNDDDDQDDEDQDDDDQDDEDKQDDQDDGNNQDGDEDNQDEDDGPFLSAIFSQRMKELTDNPPV